MTQKFSRYCSKFCSFARLLPLLLKDESVDYEGRLPQVYMPLKKACEDAFLRQDDVESFITKLEAR